MDSIPEGMARIIVVGATSSGKTTVARALAACLNARHIELDALSWGPNWQAVPEDALFERLRQAIDTPRWVIDGNYGRTRSITWPLADTIIWLDYPIIVNVWRLTRRTLRRFITQEDLWGTGNRETLFKHLQPTNDSLYYWLFKTYWRRKREIPQILSLPEHQHLRLVHLTSPRATERWLTVLCQQQSAH